MGEQKKSVLKCFYYWAIQYLELSRIIKNFYTLTFNGIDYTRNSCLKISFLGTDKQSFWQKVMVMADDILLPKTPGSHSVRTLKKSVLSSYKFHWESSIMPDIETSWEILVSKDFLVYYFYFWLLLKQTREK